MDYRNWNLEPAGGRSTLMVGRAESLKAAGVRAVTAVAGKLFQIRIHLG